MGSTCVEVPPELVAAFDALDAAVATIGEFNLDNYHPGLRLHALERLEHARRQQMVPSHDLIAGLAKEDPADVGGPVHKVIADWLRISC
ncbi:MAG: HNH endonuclease, partial [Mycobacterium sp.]|nr:HNH endonuclease [Mycobacterium sp.]